MASLVTEETAQEYPDQVLWIKGMTFGEKSRNDLDAKLRKEERQVFLERVCALLNSGGGILCAETRDPKYNYNEDGIGHDLEDGLKTLLESARMQDFLQVTQQDNEMRFYVRSWFSAEGRARLCSLSTGLVERSGRSAVVMSPSAAVGFLKREDVIQEPCVKKQKWAEGSDEDIYNKASDFYDNETAQLKEILDFGESVNVEFKSFEKESKLIVRLNMLLPKYISAFANTLGGFVFAGVDDKTRKVVGCGRGLDPSALKNSVKAICDKAVDRAIHTHHCADRNAWRPEFKVFPISAAAADLHPGYIVAIKILPFCCAVFEDDPESWEIKEGTVSRLKCRDWLGKLQFPIIDDDLVKKFESVLNLQDSPPQCQPVHSIEKITKLQERMFPVPNINNTQLSICNKLFEECPNVYSTFSKLQSKAGILLPSKSWAADIGHPGNKDVIGEALLISSGEYPTLVSVVKQETPELWKYARKTAFHLKQKLVNLGGYTKGICVVPCLLNCITGELMKDGTGNLPLYPQSYTLGDVKEVKALLRSLVIVVLSFISPLRDRLGSEILNLLTEEQYSILQFYEGHKHLFIHGLPGSGKTLVAMEKIRKLKNVDQCESENILYLCENAGLKCFMRTQNLCICATRSEFMKNTLDLSHIEHIMVDEAQNFRLEDGNWYRKAQRLVKRTKGILWVFLDYFQTYHPYNSGLPPLPKQTNCAFLVRVVRNSGKVFNQMNELLKMIESHSDGHMLSHLKSMREKMTHVPSLEGNFYSTTCLDLKTEVLSCVATLLGRGHSPRDIAVLFSTKDSLSSLFGNEYDKPPFPHGTIERIDADVVVIDTIRRFSGLEKDIVILVEPAAHISHLSVEHSLLLSACSRARIQLYLYRNPHDEV